MKKLLEIAPSIGAVIAAAGCPICFPALAAVGSLFGLGAFAAYESQFIVLTQVFIAMSMIFAFLSYRRTQYVPSLIVSIISGVLFFVAWYAIKSTALIYFSMAGLFVTAIWNIITEKRKSSG